MSEEKDYYRDLVRRIRNREEWRDFDQPHFLSELNDVADEMWEKRTLEGYLAALMIYHQLAEEMLRLLLRCSEFFIQLELFPTRIRFPAREKLMFGRIIDALKGTIDFENKSDIIRLALSFNESRVALVHRLTKHSSLDDIKNKAQGVKMDFDTLYKKFEGAHNWFLRSFEGCSKDVGWDMYLTKD